MAAIVNDIDVLLQAASTRLIPVTLPPTVLIPALKGITLAYPTTTFQVDNSGVGTPTSITITATLRQITGTITWSVVSGVATLTGSGDSRTLAFADMGSTYATIQASCTDGGITYSAQVSITKVTDGARGSVGSLTGYGSAYGIVTSSWSDGLANRVIYNMLTGAALTTALASTTHLLRGDTVTLSNGTSFAETRIWDGYSWLTPGVVIDGNLIVNGTVSADKVTAGSIQTGYLANARIKIGDISFIGSITSPLHSEKVSARSNQALITALNAKDDSVAIWGSSVWTSGNAVSGTWHSSTTESGAGRWQYIGVLGSNLYGAAVAGRVYGTGQGAAFSYFTGANSATPGSATNQAGFATSTRAGTFAGAVELTGTGSPLYLNGSAGTSGQVLTSAGSTGTPTWTTPSAGSTVTYSSIQTALSPAQSTPLDLGGTFRATGTAAPTSGTGVELAYLSPNAFLIAATRTTGGSVSAYVPLQIQASTITLNVAPSWTTPATSSNGTTGATTAYVVSRIANDAPSKTGTGASGTWAISVTGNAATVGGVKVVGGSATTGSGGSVSVSTGLTTVAGFSATAIDGFVCGISAVSGGSVTVTTRAVGGGALAGSQAFRWTATGT